MVMFNSYVSHYQRVKLLHMDSWELQPDDHAVKVLLVERTPRILQWPFSPKRIGWAYWKRATAAAFVPIEIKSKMIMHSFSYYSTVVIWKIPENTWRWPVMSEGKLLDALTVWCDKPPTAFTIFHLPFSRLQRVLKHWVMCKIFFLSIH